MQDEKQAEGVETETERKLRAVRAARAKLLAEVAAERAAREPEELLRREERALRDDSAIVEFEKKKGKQGDRIYVVKGVDAPEADIVIVERPNPVAFKRFQDLETTQVKHIEELVMPCVLYPSRDVVDRLISVERPALLLRLMQGVSYLAGARRADEQGKA